MVEFLRGGVSSLTVEWKSPDGLNRTFSVHPQYNVAGTHNSLIYN